jgi:hypothetical protein
MKKLYSEPVLRELSKSEAILRIGDTKPFRATSKPKRGE